jgi:hypothetical protein
MGSLQVQRFQKATWAGPQFAAGLVVTRPPGYVQWLVGDIEAAVSPRPRPPTNCLDSGSSRCCRAIFKSCRSRYIICAQPISQQLQNPLSGPAIVPLVTDCIAYSFLSFHAVPMAKPGLERLAHSLIPRDGGFCLANEIEAGLTGSPYS